MSKVRKQMWLDRKRCSTEQGLDDDDNDNDDDDDDDNDADDGGVIQNI
jgi:hypothetical protein